MFETVRKVQGEGEEIEKSIEIERAERNINICVTKLKEIKGVERYAILRKYNHKKYDMVERELQVVQETERSQ